VEEVAVLVVAGYLGSGKTTLVNQVLRSPAAPRTAVVVNDFGAVGIDEHLISGCDGDVIALANGCICCTYGASLTGTLLDLLERDEALRLVIIETSGVADPTEVVRQSSLPGFVRARVVTVVDAEDVRRRASDRFVGRTVLGQIAAAGLLVLNKVDLVPSEAALAEVRTFLDAVAPSIPVVEAVHGSVPLLTLLHAAVHGSIGVDVDEAAPSERGHGHVSWSWSHPGPIGREPFEKFLADLPTTVVRAKGIVTFADALSTRVEFHCVGGRIEVRSAGMWAGPCSSGLW
jgi:G3E family GTPase